MKTRGGNGEAGAVRSSAEWWEQSWQDMVGDVRDDGASGRSGSLRQKVQESGVVESAVGKGDVQRWQRGAGGDGGDLVVVEKAWWRSSGGGDACNGGSRKGEGVSKSGCYTSIINSVFLEKNSFGERGALDAPCHVRSHFLEFIR